MPPQDGLGGTLDFDTTDHGQDAPPGGGDGGCGRGSVLGGFIARYVSEGSAMLVNGKFGDAMMNVRPLAVHAFVPQRQPRENPRPKERGTRP